MSGVWDLLLRSLPILIGGGVVQLIIFFMRRKGEVRTLDAAAAKVDVDADSVLVSTAERSVLIAAGQRDTAIARSEHLEREIENRANEAKALAEEASRTRRKLARAEADAAILKHTVEGLTDDLRRAERDVKDCKEEIDGLRGQMADLVANRTGASDAARRSGHQPPR